MPIKISKNKSLKELSTFKIGGLAKYFTVVTSKQETVSALKFAKKYKLPFHFVGKGSNTLFDDRGFNGLIILNKIDFCRIDQGVIHVGAGFNFSHLGIQTAKKGLTGLEFASGIPASVGGAIFMNAGANGSETFDCLKKVIYLEEDGNIIEYTKEDLEFAYRYSTFQKKRGMILEAIFELDKNDQARKKQLNILNYRINSQPYSDSSAGCIFRNPSAELSAAFIIDSLSLKGMKIGGAVISKKHANFIINNGTATAKDVLQLIKYIQNKVKALTGYDLKPEVKFVIYDPKFISSRSALS